MPNLAHASSLNGAGVTWGTYATEALASWQQPVMPTGSNTITLLSPWPEYPNPPQWTSVPQITVSGGTVSSITIGGGASVGTSGTFGVRNIQPVVITYTVAPTVSWSLAPWFQPDPLNAKNAMNV